MPPPGMIRHAVSCGHPPDYDPVGGMIGPAEGMEGMNPRRTLGRRTLGVAAAAVALVALAACGGSTASTQSVSPPRDPQQVAELEALYRARQDSALMRFNEADVRFMQGMIAHHTQALIMSRLAASHGASPQVLTLTARTINAQSDEIATMQRWLADRGQPVPEIHIMGTSMMMMGPAHDMGAMPGMLTDEQMHALDAARGAEFDRLFLTYMIQHHSGAVTMVDELFATDGAAQGDATFKLASDIQVDQTTEIRRMESMLEALPDSGGLP